MGELATECGITLSLAWVFPCYTADLENEDACSCSSFVKVSPQCAQMHSK
jgi:ferredoxin-thioredoxin reductase catalytic subunit